MSKKIKINPVQISENYEVRFFSQGITFLIDDLSEITKSNLLCIITDSNVDLLYAHSFEQACRLKGFSTVRITIPAGESSKSLACVYEIYQALAINNAGRDACIIGLGGGVTLDIAGFVAATYMRGISYISIPTTLLAMVDASIGGKTGINLSEGKNLVGAFKQPSAVLMPLETLNTLSEKDWLSGCAEIAKTAMLEGEDFLTWLRENTEGLVSRNEDSVNAAVQQSVLFKAKIIEADSLELNGQRVLLNYGHTLGHALEVCCGYGSVSHGQAVAEGMRFAARLAVEVEDIPVSFVKEQDKLLDSLNLVGLPFDVSADDIYKAMLHDKKNKDETVRFVLPDKNNSFHAVLVQEEILKKHLDAWVKAKHLL